MLLVELNLVFRVRPFRGFSLGSSKGLFILRLSFRVYCKHLSWNWRLMCLSELFQRQKLLSWCVKVPQNYCVLLKVLSRNKSSQIKRKSGSLAYFWLFDAAQASSCRRAEKSLIFCRSKFTILVFETFRSIYSFTSWHCHPTKVSFNILAFWWKLYSALGCHCTFNSHPESPRPGPYSKCSKRGEVWCSY